MNVYESRALLIAGGWDLDSIRHAERVDNHVPCPADCTVCTRTRAHADCTGCPDC